MAFTSPAQPSLPRQLRISAFYRYRALARRKRQDVRQAIRPSVQLGAFALPPEFTEVGQGVALFSKDLDEMLPMAYF